MHLVHVLCEQLPRRRDLIIQMNLGFLSSRAMCPMWNLRANCPEQALTLNPRLQTVEQQNKELPLMKPRPSIALAVQALWKSKRWLI